MQSKLGEISGINAILSVFIVVGVVYLGMAGVKTTGDDRLFFEAMFFISLSSVFCLSYYRTNLLILFRAILWICETLSFPQKKVMSLVFAALFLLYGGWNFYLWLFANTLN